MAMIMIKPAQRPRPVELTIINVENQQSLALPYGMYHIQLELLRVFSYLAQVALVVQV